MDNKKTTKKAYNNIAKQYFDAYKDDISDLPYINVFLNNCNGKILDLGCGMGHYSRYITSKGFEVVGIDFSQEMLKIAREENNKIRYIESDICNLPDNLDKNFDGVLIAYVLQHLSKDEARKCLIELKKHINKDAKLLIFLREGENTLMEKEPFDDNFTYTIKEYTKKEIIELLTDCGYKNIITTEKPYISDENSLCLRTIVLYANCSLPRNVSYQ